MRIHDRCPRAGRWCLLAVAASAAAAVASLEGILDFSVDDPRPLARAVEILEARTGVAVTYEDPPYAHESEVRDVTLLVRSDLDRFPPGRAPRVFVPRGGRLSFRVPDPTGSADPASLLQEILDAHHAAGNPGRFRLLDAGSMLHVVPAMARNGDGDWVPARSLLDLPISLPREERTAARTMLAVCEALSRAAGRTVALGTIPANLLSRSRLEIGAASEPAREVLARALAALPARLSWQLFHDPGLGWHGLNLHVVAGR